MLKIIGIFLFCGAIWLVFILYDRQQRRNVQMLSKYVRLVETVHAQISFLQTDIYSVFKKVLLEPQFLEFRFLESLTNLHNDWNYSGILERIPAFFPKRNVLSEFLAGLGQSDLAGQKEHCEIYKVLFSNARDLFQQEYADKGKLYRSLGLFLAAGIAVLLL